MRLSKPRSIPFRALGLLGMSLALMFCEPGKSLDPVPKPPDAANQDAKIVFNASVTQLLPSDTGSATVSITDSADKPLLKARVSIVSTKFTILSASGPSPLIIDSVPADGKVSFRFTSGAAGEGTITARVTAGTKVTSQSISIIVSEKPVAPKLVESIPPTVRPRDTVAMSFIVVDSAGEKPLANAVVTIFSQQFGIHKVGSSDTMSTDTTGGDGKVAFRIQTPAITGPGSVTARVRTAGGVLRTFTFTVEVVEGATVERPRKMVFTAMRSTLKADGSDSTVLRVLVKDDNNNPMAGETILFTATGGVVEASATTDSWGQASSILISERANKSVVVTATLAKTGATAQQTVAFDGVNIAISPSKRVLLQGQVNPVIFELRDGGNVPMSGDSLEVVVRGSSGGFGQTGKDSLVVITDTKGQYRTTVTSTRFRDVFLVARALGARSEDTIVFTNNTLNLQASASSLAGDGSDKLTLTASLQNELASPINGAELRWTTTFGTFTTTPKSITTGAGQSSIDLKAPNGSGLAIVNVEAFQVLGDGVRKLIASGNITIPVKALRVSRLTMKVTPDNIPVKIGETKLIAQAYDSSDNVMTGVLVSFRLVKGAGGGDEVISPPVDYTKAGTAEATLRAGGVISLYQGVKIAALAIDVSGGDTTIIASSDTVRLTISGPPHKISVGVNIEKGLNPEDGTFGLPTAAVVTDVNGNLVADGVVVNFSTTPAGAHKMVQTWSWTDDAPWFDDDSASLFFPWTDYNNNSRLDDKEEPSAFNGNNPARGEDLDGNGYILEAPDSFNDLNRNGIFDNDPLFPAEPPLVRFHGVTGALLPNIWPDVNGNGRQDLVEIITFDKNGDGRCDCVGTRRASDGALYEKAWFNSEPIRPFPGEASVGIQKEVATVGGKATTQIWYVQSMALVVDIRITAEANGVRSFVDVRPLPIVKSDEK